MGKSLNGRELGVGITQRKNGLYQARFTDQLGKRRTIYNESLTELRKRLRQEQVKNDHNIFMASKRITLNDWYCEWINVFKLNCRSTTIKTYNSRYKAIAKQLGSMYLDELNVVDIQRAFNNLQSDAQRKTVKKVLSSMLDKAVETNLIEKNLAKNINTVIDKTKKKEPRVLTKDEEKLLIKYSSNTIIGNLIIVGLGTGMRQGELRGLQKEDIDFKNNCIYVRRTLCCDYGFELHEPKTSAGVRLIPMTPTVRNALINQLNKSQKNKTQYNQYVFLGRSGKPILPAAIKQSMDRIIVQIRKDNPNFKNVTPHAMRHTFATRAIEHGMNPKVLQKILGHSDISMTMNLYCHATNDALYEAMEIFS